jgi:hypothetical protein
VYVLSTNTIPTPLPPFHAYASPGTLTFGSCTSREYDSGLATSITITGTTTATDGTGYYRDPLNGNHPFAIVNGSFSISGVTVYNGWNNISLSDTNYNYFDLYVYTTNGVAKPKFVTTTSPANNAAVSGPTTVTGTIADPTGSGYRPDTVYASVWDGTTGLFRDYSSDLYMQQQYGYGAIAFDGSTFSFTHDFGPSPTGYSYIDVYAYDSVNGIQHGHLIYVNSAGMSDYFYKPGAKRIITPAMFKQQIDARNRLQRERKFRFFKQ